MNDRRRTWIVALLLSPLLGALPAAFALPRALAEPIVVESVLLRLIEEVDVPAREAGVLERLGVREGELVKRDAELGRLDDVEARLAVEQAEQALEVARLESANDVRVRFAEKSQAVAQAEWKRAAESVAKYQKSVSDTELDRLRLTVERSALEVEQARHELAVAEANRLLRASELRTAEQAVARRRIAAPLDGMVVEIAAQRGEWIEPGAKVLRIVRIDRLRAEGFLPASAAARDLQGKRVKLTIDADDARGGKPRMVAGQVVFVSPELDPVNRQVRVWAEVENPDGTLRPGLRGRLMIDAGGLAAPGGPPSGSGAPKASSESSGS